MEVLVFRTNVTSKRKVSMVAPLLTSLPSIRQWNFDLEDCDRMLRIGATGLDAALVERVLDTAGFSCRVMDW